MVCEQSRLLRTLLKAGNEKFMLKYAVRVRQQSTGSSELAGFFGSTDVLVPVPGSTPEMDSRIWAAEHLASALINVGLGGSYWPGLKRVSAVRKSATAPPGARPSVSLHYQSFCIDSFSAAPERFILVDDVITKGRTLLAAAIRLHEAFPAAEIRAFALVRTMGLVPEVGHLLEPCKGRIRWRAGDADRSP
jgi:predicted amidophosphoribosyltransferase